MLPKPCFLQVFNKGLGSSWIGYMTGQVEFNTELFTSETTAVMKLSDDSNKHTIFTGGTYQVTVYTTMYLYYVAI